MNELSENLKSLLSMEGSHDCTLEVTTSTCECSGEDETVKFKVHKWILAARSPVFYAMLTGEMKEACTAVIHIKDFCPAVVESLVEFIYCGETEYSSIQHCLDVCIAADKYAVISQIDHAEKYFISKFTQYEGKVSKDQFIFLFKISEELNLKKLEQKCIQFLLKWEKTLKENWQYPVFLTLSQAHKVITFMCDKENGT